jgi:predicted MFS family arabinose efflux permease
MVTLYFYARAALERDGFRDALAGQWVMVGAASQMTMSALIALSGEAVRPRVWLAVGLGAAALGALLAAHGGPAWVYAATAACMGLWMAARNSCHAPQVMRLAPGRDGTAPIGLASGIALACSGVAPYAAGLLVPLLGYGPIFWGVAVLGSASALLLLRWIPRGGPPRSRLRGGRV